MVIRKVLVPVAILAIACGRPAEDSETCAEPEGGTLRSAVEELQRPREAPSGARSLVNEAHSVTDRASERIEALEQLIGDM